MSTDVILKFAVIGHPNEGKSSIVSTLAEDDSVRISPTPGETVTCRVFPVKIDGIDRIHFIDTPGFQRPRQTLDWITGFSATGTGMLKAFLEAHQSDPDFRSECELLTPMAEGAAIIYVVDASRPLRRHDKLEMEILRSTGKPRIALINCKSDATDFLADWKNELMVHFNSFRIFNAHRATYAERIDLLEGLKLISPDWKSAVTHVIDVFKVDWKRRNLETATLICELLEQCLTHKVSKTYFGSSDRESVSQNLIGTYQKDIRRFEEKIHRKIRNCYKQNIFTIDLPAHSILHRDLFHQETWKVLGLTRVQLGAVAAAGGGLAGASIDIAAAGITFGIFTGIGSVLGAGTALMFGKKIAKVKIIGSRLSGFEMVIGPSHNPQFPFIIIDRAILYYTHIINWAHGRRDYQNHHSPIAPPDNSNATDSNTHNATETPDKGAVSQWPVQRKQLCRAFFDQVQKGNLVKIEITRQQLISVLANELQEISQDHK